MHGTGRGGFSIYRKPGQKLPHIVCVKKEMEIRKGPGTGYGKADRKCPAGLFTIAEVKNDWGKLKSGVGWILMSKTDKNVRKQMPVGCIGVVRLTG